MGTFDVDELPGMDDDIFVEGVVHRVRSVKRLHFRSGDHDGTVLELIIHAASNFTPEGD